MNNDLMLILFEYGWTLRIIDTSRHLATNVFIISCFSTIIFLQPFPHTNATHHSVYYQKIVNKKSFSTTFSIQCDTHCSLLLHYFYECLLKCVYRHSNVKASIFVSLICEARRRSERKELESKEGIWRWILGIRKVKCRSGHA